MVGGAWRNISVKGRSLRLEDLLTSWLCQMFVGEVSMYVMKNTREALLAQERTIVTGDCCYLNPLMRRVVRFIGENRPQRSV